MTIESIDDDLAKQMHIMLYIVAAAGFPNRPPPVDVSFAGIMVDSIHPGACWLRMLNAVGVRLEESGAATINA